MTERLLQYIWQFQHYNSKVLLTDEGEPLQIIHPGILNSNQGPDFIDAKLKINNTTWAGSIELHINAADWNRHKHSSDKNYNNVILHVVWNNDMQFTLPFSTLTLGDKVSKLLLTRYDELMQTNAFIPCQDNIRQVNDISWQSWKERVLVERMEDKTRLVLDLLQKSKNHWEETFWWLLARNFGMKLNTVAFEYMARSIPVTILAKHKDQVNQTEALLLGQAGLLEGNFTDDYPVMLQKEYQFLKKKYKLLKVEASVLFLRMRPSNFPTVRLAQLAMLIHQSVHLFSRIKEVTDLSQVNALLNVTANDYWHYHYVFDEATNFKKKTLGKQMIDNIIINTIVPVLFAYGHYHNEHIYKDKALSWLELTGPEKNNISNGFAALGISNKTAFDTQALIQLKNAYCNKKRCLDCCAGNQLIRNL